MAPITVPSDTALDVSYEFHPTENAASDALIAVHHGMAHSREHMQELVGKLMEERLHVATVDLHSRSNLNGLNHNREGLMQALEQIENDTNLKIGTVVGHSLGGMTTQEMMQKYEHTRRPTVLMSPVPLEGVGPAIIRTIKKFPLTYAASVATLSVKRLLTEPVVGTLFHDNETPAELIKDTHAKIKDFPFVSYMQLGPHKFIRQRIEDSGMPTLLMRSDTDFLFETDEYISTRLLYKNFTEKRMEGGHDFFRQSPILTASYIANFHHRNNR